MIFIIRTHPNKRTTQVNRLAVNHLIVIDIPVHLSLNEDIKSDMGAIMVAETPPRLDASTIDILLFFSGPRRTNNILQKLACVITFDSDKSTLRVLHKSLDDFLTDEKRCSVEWAAYP